MLPIQTTVEGNGNGGDGTLDSRSDTGGMDAELIRIPNVGKEIAGVKEFPSNNA